MNYWLIKTEPQDFSWNDMINCTIAKWDGVRNYQAINNLKKMRVGDLAFFYHTGKEKSIVGIVEVHRTYYTDTRDSSYGAVDVKVFTALNKKISLNTLKNNSYLQNMSTLHQPRLSVSPVTNYEKYIILKIAETSLC